MLPKARAATHCKPLLLGKITMLEELDVIVDKMPSPEFVKGASNLPVALTFNRSQPIVLTINWQWVLAKITEALIAKDSKRVFKLLFSDLVDYVQLNHNAVEDIRSLVRQSVDENTLRTTQTKINVLKALMSEYLYQPQTSQSRLNCVINESSLIVEELKNLEVVGVGAFMLASSFHLALLQEKASLDSREWSCVKNLVIEYSQYAANVTPKLFRLSVGLIDKKCQCTRWESDFKVTEKLTAYECFYSDGKDIHLFRATSSNAGFECNKHRLKMFQFVTNRVNQIAVQPVRTALKQWRNMAASI